MASLHLSFPSLISPYPSQLSHNPSLLSHHINLTSPHSRLTSFSRPRSTLDAKDPSTAPLVQEEQSAVPNKGVEESVSVLKSAAKTRRVAKDEVLSALSVIKKAKLDPSGFLGTLGGSGSPGRTWMLVFTAQVVVSLFVDWFLLIWASLMLYVVDLKSGQSRRAANG
ncbi:hypothetical protein Sjap_015142 [Stephania japonica]|uniref:Uncharacterized protein n=1 Tax=Stephania japonica TaxID=461633 RepID=A0AAP0IJ13_9MAGN